MFRIRYVSKYIGLAPSSEDRRSRQVAHPRHRVSLQLESLEERVVPDASLISLVPGSAVIPASMSSQSVPITVGVTSPLGSVNLGTAGVELLVNGQPVAGGMAGVSNGQATVTLPVPAGLLSGTYTLLEEYLQGSTPLASAPGSLTVTGNPSGAGSGSGGSGAGAGAGSGSASQSPLQAAIEVAIDTAAILLQGNLAQEEGLQIASQVFLNKPLPSDLLSDLLNHLGPAEGLGLVGIAVGIDYANNNATTSSS